MTRRIKRHATWAVLALLVLLAHGALLHGLGTQVNTHKLLITATTSAASRPLAVSAATPVPARVSKPQPVVSRQMPRPLSSTAPPDAEAATDATLPSPPQQARMPDLPQASTDALRPELTSVAENGTAPASQAGPKTTPGAGPSASHSGGVPTEALASGSAPHNATMAWRTPNPVRLGYEVNASARGRSWHAQGELLWQHLDGRYEARMEVRAFLLGARSQLSTGRIGSQGLEPERFADRGRQELAAHFVPASASGPARVVFSANTPEVLLSPGAQDRLSVLLQLAGWADAQAQMLQPGLSLNVQTVGAREAQIWIFVVEGLQTIELPGGRLDAWKLTRQPRREHDQRVEVWLAPQLQYLPARVLITQTTGDFVDQQWRGSLPP